MSEEKDGLSSFSPTAYVLMAIVFACAISVGILQKWLEPGLVSGVALFCFVAIPHWIGRKVATKKGATPVTLIISVFASFWTLLSFCWVTSVAGPEIKEELDQVLRVIEPVMILFIASVAINHYLLKRKWNLGLILLIGLNSAIVCLWLPMIGVMIGRNFSSWWIGFLGGWCWITCFWEMKINELAHEQK